MMRSGGKGRRGVIEQDLPPHFEDREAPSRARMAAQGRGDREIVAQYHSGAAVS